MIISFVPGGPNDIVGRALARRLEESLSQTVIVDNRGGANRTLGTALAARTAPDGYTVLIGSLGTLGISPGIYPKLGYDAIRDFEHIAMIAVVANLLVVHPTVPELVRTHPASGRKSLVLASHITRIYGMDEAEGRRLVDDLMAYATQPQFVYTHRSPVDDVVLWDNRCTMHRGRPHDESLRRAMRRATVADDGPTIPENRQPDRNRVDA